MPASAYRSSLLDLSVLTTRDVLALWRLVSGSSAGAIRDALMDVLPSIGSTNGGIASTLAADFYIESRTEAGVRGSFTPEPAIEPTSGRYEALVRWGVDPLGQAVPDEALTFSRVAGGLQRIVAAQANETTVRATERDEMASGWRRVASSNACRFCRMLAARGAVYSSKTVRFASHDWCGCGAVAAFEPGRPASVEQYAASSRRRTEADRARVRAYLSGMSDSPREPEQRLSAFDAMSLAQIDNQISILENLKDSDYRTTTLAKLRARRLQLAA